MANLRKTINGTVWRVALAVAAICMAAVSSSYAAELHDGAIVTRTPLRNAPAVFAEKGAGTVAFLGGSITEANGFRPLVETSLTNRFPTAQLSFTRAGLSSTCSTAGAFRFGDDVLAKAKGLDPSVYVLLYMLDSVAQQAESSVVRHLSLVISG